MVEIIVNGHSGHEKNAFSLPPRVYVRFYADPNTTCYVPGFHVQDVVRQLKAGVGHEAQPGNIVNDYMIQFNARDPQEGVFNMQGNKLSNIGHAISLRALTQGLQAMYPDGKIMIYAIFCRGSARESFAGKVAPVSEHYGLQALANDPPLDFDMDLTGGKRRKHKRRTRHRKKRRRKRSRKSRRRKSRKSNRRRSRKSRRRR